MFAPLLFVANPVKTSAWVVFYNPDSVASFERNASKLADVCVEWIQAQADGTAKRRVHEKRAGDRFWIAAKKTQVKTFAMTNNSTGMGFDAVRVSKFLATPATQAAHADDLVKIVVGDGFDGLDLDYESLKADDRDRFSSFVRVVAGKLHKRGKLISVTVHPKFAEPGSWDGDKAQDWPTLGKAVDVFRVMAYDEHMEGGPAGPVASLGFVEKVAKFAASAVDPRKVELGVPSYGYGYGSRTGSFVWSGFQEIPGDAVRDPGSMELVKKGEKWEAWFPDAKAARAKKAIAKRYGFRGIAVWRMGAEAPGTFE